MKMCSCRTWNDPSMSQMLFEIKHEKLTNKRLHNSKSCQLWESRPHPQKQYGYAAHTVTLPLRSWSSADFLHASLCRFPFGFSSLPQPLPFSLPWDLRVYTRSTDYPFTTARIQLLYEILLPTVISQLQNKQQTVLKALWCPRSCFTFSPSNAGPNNHSTWRLTLVVASKRCDWETSWYNTPHLRHPSSPPHPTIWFLCLFIL